VHMPAHHGVRCSSGGGERGVENPADVGAATVVGIGRVRGWCTATSSAPSVGAADSSGVLTGPAQSTTDRWLSRRRLIAGRPWLNL
jgi:hypothetical protein